MNILFQVQYLGRGGKVRGSGCLMKSKYHHQIDISVVSGCKPV